MCCKNDETLEILEPNNNLVLTKINVQVLHYVINKSNTISDDISFC